jgi:hypothetical protein
LLHERRPGIFIHGGFGDRLLRLRPRQAHAHTHWCMLAGVKALSGNPGLVGHKTPRNGD